MRVTIKKGIANGIINAQPSKSFSHRLLIAASLSNKESVVKNIVLSNDVVATINCLKVLGNQISYDGNNVIIKKIDNFKLPDELVFDCYESGSTLRFFIPIALTTGKKLIFKGTKKLISRGIGVYQEICEKQNIKVIIKEEEIIFNGILKPGKFEVVGNISSQFISGLLFALPLLNDQSDLVVTTELESKNYIDMTIDVLKMSNVEILEENNCYKILKGQKYCGGEFVVEGDYSNASFLDCLNYLGGRVIIKGLNPLSKQGDKVYQDLFNSLNNSNCYIDLKNCIDLGPILFAFSSLKNGAKFINTKRLEIKESNRVLDLKEELEKFGVDVVVSNNQVDINNYDIHAPKEILNGKNDHRIVMALAIMLTIYGGTIEGAEAINKSYPSFFKDLESLGIEVLYE